MNAIWPLTTSVVQKLWCCVQARKVPGLVPSQGLVLWSGAQYFPFAFFPSHSGPITTSLNGVLKGISRRCL